MARHTARPSAGRRGGLRERVPARVLFLVGLALITAGSSLVLFVSPGVLRSDSTTSTSGTESGQSSELADPTSRSTEGTTTSAATTTASTLGEVASQEPVEDEQAASVEEALQDLDVRQNLSDFIAVLGSPSTLDSQASFQYVEFDQGEFVVQVAASPIGEVTGFVITSCSADFRPAFPVRGRDGASQSTDLVESVTLNVTSMAEAGGVAPTLVSYGIGVNGLLYTFYETEYLGSVSAYTSTVWGIDSRCGDRENLGDLSLVGTDRLNDATSEAVPLDPDIQEWRRTATINSYGRLDSSGPESDLIFGLA